MKYDKRSGTQFHLRNIQISGDSRGQQASHDVY